MQEYKRLKREVEKKSGLISAELDNLTQEQETTRNSVEFDKRRLDTWTNKIAEVGVISTGWAKKNVLLRFFGEKHKSMVFLAYVVVQGGPKNCNFRFLNPGSIA